jgi:glycerol-1-phosphate dehydrogenase [NAD(P)+]
VVGVGGGKTIDVAKYAGSLTGLPMVSVATSLAHDGLASPVASLTHDGRKGSYGVHLPLVVIVDLDFVRRSPARHTLSGIGDLVSNLSAIEDWRLAERERGERVDGLAVTFARTAAEAVIDRNDAIDSDAFLTALAEGLLLGGMAMSVAGSSRPCSGACHEISHAIDALYGTQTYHGEQVAVGALFASFLRGDQVLARTDACFRRYGVPRLPADIGLSAAQFTAAVVEAPSTRPDRYTILEHLDLSPDDARRQVDAFCEALGR